MVVALSNGGLPRRKCCPEKAAPPFSETELECCEGKVVATCVIVRDGLPPVVFNSHSGLSGSSRLEGDVELGAEIGWEAGITPGEHQQPSEGPRCR